MYFTSHNRHYDAAVNPQSCVVRHGANLQIADQSLSRFPLMSSATNEPDAFCSFMFRVQQHSRQRTVEKSEL